MFLSLYQDPFQARETSPACSGVGCGYRGTCRRVRRRPVQVSPDSSRCLPGPGRTWPRASPFSLALSLTHAPRSSASSSSRCSSPSRGWCPPAAWRSCTGPCCLGWTSTAPCPSSGRVSGAAARGRREDRLSSPFALAPGRGQPCRHGPGHGDRAVRGASGWKHQPQGREQASQGLPQLPASDE